MIDWKLKPEEMEKMALARDLKSANCKQIHEDGSIEISYDHHYSGTLEFYFETGMEGLASTLHDDRGWHEEHAFNNDTKEWDGPLTKFKSLEWSVFMKGGEYLTVFDKDHQVIWEGLLLRDIKAVKDKQYRHHFLPQNIPYEDWVKWCQKEYRAEIQTNEPVLADNEEYQEEMKIRNKKD